MSETKDVGFENLAPVQALELARLVDLEAHWENLRRTPSPAQAPPSTEELHGKQRAYEAFHAKLTAYNQRHTPAHLPELLLNTPARLGKWCQAMRDLCLRIEHDAHAPCPVHLVEKADRWADRVARRVGKPGLHQEPPPGTIREAIRHLDLLGKWCDDLARAVSPA